MSELALLFQPLVALLVVCAIAVVLLRWGARRGWGMTKQGERIRVVERVAVDARRSLAIVEVDGRSLLLGFGDSGPPNYLCDLGIGAETRDVGRDLSLVSSETTSRLHS